MKNFLKNIKFWLKFGKYKQLIGVVIGIISFFIMYEKDVDLFLCLILSLLIAIVSVTIIQIYLINIYGDNYVEQTQKIRYIPKDLIKGKSANLDELIELDNELVAFLDKYSSGKKTNYFERELNKQWEIHGDDFTYRADQILQKMDNVELLGAIAATEEITHIVDIFQYFEPFIIENLDELIEHPENAYDFYLKNIIKQEELSEVVINEYYYNKLIEMNYFDEIEEFVLSKMSNEELIKLANASKDWEEKLHFYGFLSKDKN